MKRGAWRTEFVFWTFALAIGLTAGTFLLGPSLDPTNIDWLAADAAQNYMGWAFLRDDPKWTFPPTWAHQIGYPIGVSIGFLDGIPLVAAILRPFSTLLSHPFQYLGLFGWISVVLQAYFGSKLVWRLCGESIPTALLGGAFLALAPAFVFRVGPHLSLTSQWLILAALWRYATPHKNQTVRSWYWPFFAIQAIAGTIHPYIAALCLLIALAACLHLLLERRCRFVTALILAIVSVAVTLGSFWLAGFIPVTSWRFYIAEPFGSYSMNLLSPIDPNEWNSILLPRQAMTGQAQLEGYNYLGLGTLLLLALGAVALGWKRVTPRWTFLLPLGLIGAISVFLALGPQITFGARTIAVLPIPEMLMNFLSPFRASGRLFLIAYYLLFMLAFVSMYRGVRPPYRGIVLIICLIIQVADTRPLWAYVRSVKHAHHPDILGSAEWRGIGDAHRHLTVLPPWQCTPHGTPGGLNSYWLFGRAALRERMTSNTYYANRISETERRFHCYESVGRIRAEGLSTDQAYVLSDQFMRLAALKSPDRHYCRVADGFNLCAVASNRRGVADALSGRLFPPYVVGTLLRMDAAALASYGTGGWDMPDPGGVWSLGYEAGFALRVDAFPDADLDLVLRLHAFTAPRHPRQEVEVAANDTVVAKLIFEHGKNSGDARIRISRDLAARRPALHVALRIKNPATPAAVSASTDLRLLGIHLQSLQLLRHE